MTKIIHAFPQAVTTKEKIKAKGVQILWSENRKAGSMSIEGKDKASNMMPWDEVNALLSSACTTAPDDGSYDKTKFMVTFEDGDTYTGRIDLQRHTGNLNHNIAGSHIRSWMAYSIKMSNDGMADSYGPAQDYIDYLEKYEIPGNGQSYDDSHDKAREDRKVREAAQEKKEWEEKARLSSIKCEKAKAAWADLMSKKPEWAKGLAVAVMDVNKCDSYTDYFEVGAGRTVALMWLKTGRSIFSNMRKGAKLLPETADLAEKNPDNEHRENYSMGRGNYLKASGCYSDGWTVKILDLGYYENNYYASEPVETVKDFS